MSSQDDLDTRICDPKEWKPLLLNLQHETVDGSMMTGPDMIPFWKSYRHWFNSFGISLYELRTPHSRIRIERWLPPPMTAPARPPFAIRLGNGSTQPMGRTVQSKFGMGQDGAGRDVFIKITDKGSEEHRINQYLLKLEGTTKPEHCPYALRPVAVLDSPYNFSFIVMPCWGAAFFPEDFSSIRHVLVYVKSLLTGLSFLHEHRIAHRDIQDLNILVNGYCPEADERECKSIVKEHLDSSDLTFCLFDYDHAIQFPHDVSLKEYRRPSSEGEHGTFEYHPLDISLGEPQYNPFAFDVGCLGMMFLYYFSEAIRVVPQLAPLFARMSTHVVEQRFTAAEALAFFDKHLAQLPEQIEASPVVLEPGHEALHDPELYWSILSPDDRRVWREYRVPPRSWVQRLLMWFARNLKAWKILRSVRRFLNI